jgi:flap endonuclease-1
MGDYHVRPVFIFDGKPPDLKMKTLKARREYRDRARREWEEAVQRRDYSVAWKKAMRMDSLNKPMQDDARTILTLLGIPQIQAPEEGEAQAAHMARKGDVWAANSRDYDSVLFGAPRLVRYVTISGQEFLPSKGISRPLIPELIELEQLLKFLEVSREQLIDLAILVGTDFNQGIRGVGPKTALKLIKKHGTLENLPSEYQEQVPPETQEIRNLFLNPTVTNDYDLKFRGLNEVELRQFLCAERGFSPDRVDLAVKRMREFYSREKSSLRSWLNDGGTR